MNQPITLVSSMATRQILAELAASYSQTIGCPVLCEAAGGVDVARRIRADERFDVVVLADDAMRQLMAEGHILAGSIQSFARSPTAIAIRSGAPRPAWVDEAEIKAMTAPPRTIAVSSGPSGTSIRNLFHSWGMADDVQQRFVQAPAGVPVSRLIAAGQADVGFQQLSELRGEPGIDIVGLVPEELVATTVFSVGICRSPANVARARGLVDFLVSPATDPVKRAHGMAPAENN